MYTPVPPPRPDGWQPLRAGGREMRDAPEDDDALLRRLDANELYDIHRGLDWCEREMRAIGLLRPGQRGQVAALRRRWAHRWRAATGRPAVSLQAHRAWQLGAIIGISATVLAMVSGPDQQAPPARSPTLVMPVPEVAVDPAPPSIAVPVPSPAAPAASEPIATGVTDQAAKSRVRLLARRLEQCQQASLGCADVAASQFGSNVTIPELAQDRFRVAAVARSGNVFTIARGVDGVTVRTCTPADVPGCPRAGRW